MAWLWLGLVLTAAGGASLLATRVSGPERLGRRLVGPAVEIERICGDALDELSAGQAEVFLSPFAPSCRSLAQVRTVDVHAFGVEAARSHQELVRFLRDWERAAGGQRPARQVRPVLQKARAAAHDLLGSLPAEEVGRAWARRERELLVGVVAAPPEEGTLLQ